MRTTITWSLLSVLLFVSCNLKGFEKMGQESDRSFGDQHFKTAISLIELHKVRNGSYPASLDSLKYLGGWDTMLYGSVSYTKLEEGYQLDLVKGWVGKPKNLRYPDDFWKGLGCVKSNLK